MLLLHFLFNFISSKNTIIILMTEICAECKMYINYYNNNKKLNFIIDKSTVFMKITLDCLLKRVEVESKKI